jgi:serine/threonine-protein kinase PknG
LLTDVHEFGGAHRYTLPGPQKEALFAQQESLHRLLLKATAYEADDRFQSADEMAEQLLGVLREVVAVESGTPRPAPSFFFGPDLLSLEESGEMEPVHPDYRQLPLPTLDAADPAAQAVSNANGIADLKKRVLALRQAVERTPKSREARLRLAAALADVREMEEAARMFQELFEEDAWDWRVRWFQGRMKLEQLDSEEARKMFEQIYFDLPGELAPKLALGLAHELSGDLDAAIGMYDLVAHTDPSFVSAVFGLARCHHEKGDRAAAVAALDRVPQSSALHLRSRIEAARLLIKSGATTPGESELAAASVLVESLTLEAWSKFALASQILGAAVELVASRKIRETRSVKLMGAALEENELRAGWERSIRAMAQLSEGVERIRLVDRANQVRPRTLL